MILDWIRRTWNFINNLNSLIKTLIILVLFCYLVYPTIVELSKNNIIDYFETVEKLNIEDENYALKMAHYINEYVYNILLSDPDCYNVLLMNYHNSQKSLQGFKYHYLNCMTESPKNINSEPLKDYWSDLEYVYYEPELNKIKINGYLRIQNVDSIKAEFPRLYRKLKISQAKAAAFYPIEGLDSPIGMIIVLYKLPKEYTLGFYNKNVSPWILKLSNILDYLNLKLKGK